MPEITQLIRLDSSVWAYAISVPSSYGDEFIEGDDRRVICTLFGSFAFPCALMPDGQGDYFININKEIRTRFKLMPGSELQYALKKDKSEYGMPMPEELGAILEMDPEVDDYFHALTPGKQRNLIYIVAKPKNSDTRLRKAIVITEFLKNNQGKLDFKMLNEAFKLSNK
jgi:hypothetical protein